MVEPPIQEERDTVQQMYRLDNIAHVPAGINKKLVRCIISLRRQQNIVLYGRVVPYLQTAGLYHVAQLNNYWFKVDEPLISAFLERWRPKTHTFHMSFGECTVTLQDVFYQFGHPIDGEAVRGCLTDLY